MPDKFVYSPMPPPPEDKDTPPKLSKLDALRIAAATGLRVAGPWAGTALGAMGGAALGAGATAPVGGEGAVPGAAWGGAAGGALGGAASEYLAEKLEPHGPQNKNVNLGRVATSAALGAVPGSWMLRAGKPLASTAMGVGLGAAGVAGNKLSEGQGLEKSLNPAEWSKSDFIGPVIGGVSGNILSRFHAPAAPKGPTYEVQTTAQPGGQVLNPVKKGVVSVPKLEPIQGTGNISKASPDVRTPDEVASDLARFHEKVPGSPIPAEANTRVQRNMKAEAAEKMKSDASAKRELDKNNTQEARNLNKKDDYLAGLAKSDDATKKSLQKQFTGAVNAKNSNMDKFDASTKKIDANRALADKQTVVQLQKDLAQQKVDTFINRDDVEAGQESASIGTKGVTDKGEPINMRQNYHVIPKDTDGADVTSPDEGTPLDKGSVYKQGMSREDAFKAADAAGGPGVMDVIKNPEDGLHYLVPAGTKSVTAEPPVPTPDAPIAPETLNQRMQIQGKRMSKADATALAKHLGGEINQVNPRQWSVKFPEATSEEPAVPNSPTQPDLPGTPTTKGDYATLTTGADKFDSANPGPEPEGEPTFDPDELEGAPKAPPQTQARSPKDLRAIAAMQARSDAQRATAGLPPQKLPDGNLTADITDYTGGDVPTIDVEPPAPTPTVNSLTPKVRPQGPSAPARFDAKVQKIVDTADGTLPTKFTKPLPPLRAEGNALASQEAVNQPPAFIDPQAVQAGHALQSKLQGIEAPPALTPEAAAPAPAPDLTDVAPNGIQGFPVDSSTPPQINSAGEAEPTLPGIAPTVNPPAAPVAEAPFGLTPPEPPQVPKQSAGNLFGTPETFDQGVARLKANPTIPSSGSGGLKDAINRLDESTAAAPAKMAGVGTFPQLKELTNEEGPFSTVNEPPSQVNAKIPEGGAVPARLFKSPLEAAGAGYGDIKAAKAAGEAVPEEGRAIAGKAASRLNRESKLPAVPQVDPEVTAQVKSVNDEINDPNTTPVAKEMLKKWLDNFMSEKGLGGGQGGGIDPMLLARLGLGTGGAAVGAYADPDDPLTGALLGGTAGALIPSGAQALGKVDLGGIAKRLPDIQRFNYLSDPNGLAANTIGAPLGLGVTSSLERMIQGDKRGWELMKKLPSLPRRWGANMGEAGHLLADSDMNISENRQQEATNPFDRAISYPGRMITAGHLGLRDAAKEVGIPEEEAQELALGNDPGVGTGSQTLRAWGKGLQNLKASEAGTDDNPTAKNLIGNILAPFTRTATNVLAATPTRIPGIGALIKLGGGSPESWGAIGSQQLLGTAIGGGSYVLGQNTDPESARFIRKWIRNASGRYGLIATAAFEAGQAAQAGKSVPQAVKKGLLEGLPMPTTEVAKDWSDFATSPFEDTGIQFPRSAIPAIMKPALEATGISTPGKDPYAPKFNFNYSPMPPK